MSLRRRVPVLIILSLMLAAGASCSYEQEAPIGLPGCLDKCGNISVPFPFGMNRGCFRLGFEVECNHTFQPPRLFFAKGPWSPGNYGPTQETRDWYTLAGQEIQEIEQFLPLEILGISLSEGLVRTHGDISLDCSINETFIWVRGQQTYLSGPYLLSTRNVATAIGWSFDAKLTQSLRGSGYMKSCSVRLEASNMGRNGSCSGEGCCEVTVKENLNSVSVFLVQTSPYPGIEPNSCSYGMVAERGWYNFSTPDFHGFALLHKYPRGVPLLADFAIRDDLCPPQGQGHACVSSNSFCVNVTNGPGYICKCHHGYDGNPYISNGCQDIDECALRIKHPELQDIYPCSSGGICKNTPGGYDCPCKSGLRGDGKSGTCTEKFPLPAKIAVGSILGLLVAAFFVFLVLLQKERRKMEDFFVKNGGPTLEKAKMIKIYKKEDLKPILKSNNFIGKGGFGEVYKGFLDNQLVAVKKPIFSGNVTDVEQFANEVIIQSQVIHKNIVRLIGCCLEVDIPMLVYEFLSKGSLDDILHGSSQVPLDLNARLNIAAESAEGLAYMHSKTSNIILHGDVKPANILLDDNFVPKISDFGISRLIAVEKQHTNSVIGDMSYMDPVYLQTGLLTDKSDVYCFGVVLLELISRKKARHSDNNSLVKAFLDAHKTQKGATELFDKEILEPKDLEFLNKILDIAVECLDLDVDKRPEMTEVAERLLMLKRSRNK
ncbi:wall-associated receptor kinase 2-like [Oryza brachyantha]|nr:wall-associated receptor kinase 2-like [Oryza brachyantha]